MIRVGGGGAAERFDQYIKDNQIDHKKTLVKYMIKSKKNLDQVCDKICKGIKIRDAPVKVKKSHQIDTDTFKNNANKQMPFDN